MNGMVEILNVGEGDIKLTFESDDPAEVIRAARVIKDLIRRGYALLVEIDGKYTRVFEFLEDTFEYVIADYDPDYDPEEVQIEPKTKAKKKKAAKKKIPARKSKAVAVPKTAGG